MRRSPLAIGLAVLAGATLFVGGMLTERAVVSHNGPVTAGTQRSESSARTDKVGVRGQASILAYHADGIQFAAWSGHNSLTGNTINSLVGCITGAYAPFAQPCSGSWVTGIALQGGSAAAAGAATTVLTPAGCPSTAFCTGWQSTATIDQTITTAFTISFAFAGCGSGEGGPASTTCNGAFDSIAINPGISVQPGDRVVVTITFTVA
jgi:hypothetical protein